MMAPRLVQISMGVTGANTAGEPETVVGEVGTGDGSGVASMWSSTVAPDKHLSSSPFCVLVQGASPVLPSVILRMRILGVFIGQRLNKFL